MSACCDDRPRRRRGLVWLALAVIASGAIAVAALLGH